MSLIVQKYGGTSVGDVERIRDVAAPGGARRAAGDDLVVVVSAMAGRDQPPARAGARGRARSPTEREIDVLVATGEQVTAALLGARARSERGVPGASRSSATRSGSTPTAPTAGRASAASTASALARRSTAGASPWSPASRASTTTATSPRSAAAARDTTAVALAAALQADVCEIYTDVDGVYTSDPRICPAGAQARRASRYDEMLELASLGAKVLQIRSVEFAKRYGVPVHVRSSFDDGEGTWVVRGGSEHGRRPRLRRRLDRDEAKITLRGVPDRPGSRRASSARSPTPTSSST